MLTFSCKNIGTKSIGIIFKVSLFVSVSKYPQYTALVIYKQGFQGKWKSRPSQNSTNPEIACIYKYIKPRLEMPKNIDYFPGNMLWTYSNQG